MLIVHNNIWLSTLPTYWTLFCPQPPVCFPTSKSKRSETCQIWVILHSCLSDDTVFHHNVKLQSTSSSQSVASTQSFHFLSCSARLPQVNVWWPADDFSTTFSFKAYRTDNEMALHYLTTLGKKNLWAQVALNKMLTWLSSCDKCCVKEAMLKVYTRDLLGQHFHSQFFNIIISLEYDGRCYVTCLKWDSVSESLALYRLHAFLPTDCWK